MRIGSWQDATLSATESETDEIDLASDYEFLDLLVPSMIETQLYLKVAEGSENSSFSYYELGDTEGVIKTEPSTFNRACVWSIGGFRFLKICTTNPPTNDTTIRVRGRRHM